MKKKKNKENTKADAFYVDKEHLPDFSSSAPILPATESFTIDNSPLFITADPYVLDPNDSVLFPTTESYLKVKDSGRVFSFDENSPVFSTKVGAEFIKPGEQLAAELSVVSPSTSIYDDGTKLVVDYKPFSAAAEYENFRIETPNPAATVENFSITPDNSKAILWTDRQNISYAAPEQLCLTTKENLFFDGRDFSADIGIEAFSKSSTFFGSDNYNGSLNFETNLSEKLITSYPESSALFHETADALNSLVIGDIGNGIHASPQEATTVQNQFLFLSQDYSAIAVAATQPPYDINEELLNAVTKEYLDTISLAKSTAIGFDAEIEINYRYKADFDLLPRLDSLASGLGKMLLGAKQAAESENIDKERHCLTSLRELVTHVMHVLSPDADIRKWNDDPELYKNNQPTRRTRLLFICRDTQNTGVSEFVKSDIDSTLKFITFLNLGTHKVSANIGQNHLKAMVSRAVGLLGFLLDISSN